MCWRGVVIWGVRESVLEAVLEGTYMGKSAGEGVGNRSGCHRLWRVLFNGVHDVAEMRYVVAVTSAMWN